MISSGRSPDFTSCSSGNRPEWQAKQKVPAELVTYSLNGEMVYVEPPKDFEQALDFAQSVFPQLVEIPRSRINFLVNARVKHTLRKVRIAPMAWPRVLQSLSMYEIIEIAILPELRATRSATELVKPSFSQSNDATPASDEAPPKYGCAGTPGSELYNAFPDRNNLHDSRKSPYLTSEASDAHHHPPSQGVKRWTSVFSWFGMRK